MSDHYVSNTCCAVDADGTCGRCRSTRAPATHETAKTGVYETAPGKTRPSLREGWSQPRLREPDTERKPRISYP